MTKGRIFSGMQPSGRFHLGNYMGALENWVRLQHEYECFFSIVDLHALTSSYSDTSKLQENVMEMAIDWLSAGLDPEKNVIFVQSHVKEHAELALLLGMSTPLSWLERVPTYKDKLQNWSAQGKDNNTYGFLGYPVLMAADIMLYKATCVPVGEDQSAHLELTREIVRRFNYLYNREVFPEPQAVFSKAKVLPGIDGRKMSKSYGNTIPFGAGPEEMWERIRMMTTDPQRIKKTDPGHPEVCIVYAFHKVFNPEEYEEIGARCRAGEIGCVECKKRLAEKMNALLADIHTKREELSKKPEYIKEVLDFEGPLDLLIHLIEKEKIDIYDIPIVAVTEQYIEYLQAMTEFDIEIASEFLLMAATLLQIKSRMLLPKQTAEGEEDETDPRQLLVEMLVEYRRIKVCASNLAELKLQAERCRYRLPLLSGFVERSLKQYEAAELISAMLTLLSVKTENTAYIERQEFNVQDKMNEIVHMLSQHLNGVEFAKVFSRTGSRSEKVASFLAVLELLKLGVVTINQTVAFAPIYIFLRQGER